MYCPKCFRDFPAKSQVGEFQMLTCGHLVQDLPPIKPAILPEFAHCLRCDMQREIASITTSAGQITKRFLCGHINIEFAATVASPAELTIKSPKAPSPQSLPAEPTEVIHPERDNTWDELFNYQKAGVEAIENANFNFLLEDEPGLGKTAQTLQTIRYNLDKVAPVLIISPANLVFNWQRECKKWFNRGKHMTADCAPFVHTNSDGALFEGQKIYIISNMMIAKSKLLNAILEYGFKLVVFDESHHFKNNGASRTEAFKAICAKIPHKICLSATSVMNRTMELFNSLQAIAPREWPYDSYLLRFCDWHKGKPLGINKHRRDDFFKATSKYRLRRTKAEVLPDLPETQVITEFISLAGNRQFISSYNKQLDELEALMSKVSERARNTMLIIALMSSIRHLVGLAKTKQIAQLVQDFVSQTGEKITIGVHHEQVRENLASLLRYRQCSTCKNVCFDIEAPYCDICNENWTTAIQEPIQMSSESAKVKDEKQEEFRTNPNKLILIASIKGCGEGRNLQFCSNVIIAERQWNKAIEMQFEGRFHRIGSTTKVTYTYIMAANTIDELFHELVRLKAEITNSVLDVDYEQDLQFVIELAEQVIAKRMKYVG